MDIGTVVTSIITAFISTVVLQYLFAPWLEARKARKLKQAEDTAEFADKLNELAGIMWSINNYLGLAQADLDKALGRLRLQVHELALIEHIQRVVLTKRTRNAANLAIVIQQHLFGDYSSSEDSYLNSSVDVVRQVEKAVDPGSAPWSKAWARMRAHRLYKKKVAPGLVAATARVLTPRA